MLHTQAQSYSYCYFQANIMFTKIKFCHHLKRQSKHVQKTEDNNRGGLQLLSNIPWTKQVLRGLLGFISSDMLAIKVVILLTLSYRP